MPKAVYHPENVPTRRTERQRLVTIYYSSDEECEYTSTSTFKYIGKVTDSDNQTEKPAKKMGRKGPGTSRSSAGSRRSYVVRVNYTVGHTQFKYDVPMQVTKED